MKVNAIRRAFLDFFAAKGHSIVASSPLVPNNDPTLLFTNSGMVQFKNVFLGAESRPYQRATSSQRSLRAGGKHNDLENVGYTARHHTFFEMLGNFSFGDYFKRDAILYAWELLTKVYQLPVDKLWVTIYHTDQEAFDIWHETVGLAPERIIRIGDNKGALYASDNFWQMADTGPCGPCSEIFYDHGADVAGGLPGTPEEDGDRYIEIWNLVFMQYNRDAQGQLTPLPKPCVDTGMGLERIAAVLQNVHSNYEIDVFVALIDAMHQLTNLGQDMRQHPSLKVIADHIRAVSFLLLEGVVPSNENRGYVVRRIMRRAIRHGYKLGMRTPFLHQLVPCLVAEMGEAYPELHTRQSSIAEHILQEEERFLHTLSQGIGLLDDALQNLEGTSVPGALAFKLHDTYGFPLDLTADICRERGLTVDEAGFDAAMDAQKQRARAHAQFKGDYQLSDHQHQSVFCGYTQTSASGNIIGLYLGKPQNEHAVTEMIDTTQTHYLILDETPFYAESGGQVGDIGHIQADNAIFVVRDTQNIGGVTMHIGQLQEGRLHIGQTIAAHIDVKHRAEVAKNHSATHLLHKALRTILGEHVEQKGSLVEANKLRFDFSHPQAIDASTLHQVQDWVNDRILAAHGVQTQLMSIDDAKNSGAMALFDAQYGDEVRVLSIAESKELCGGTHVENTSHIGMLTITQESGVAAGIRRIEAVCGASAIKRAQQQDALLTQLAQHYKSTDILEKVQQQDMQLKVQQKNYELLEKNFLEYQMDHVHPSNHGDHSMASAVLVCGSKVLKFAAETLKNKTRVDVAIVACIEDARVHIAICAQKPYHAGKMVAQLAQTIGGQGGGRADLAQGSGVWTPDTNIAELLRSCVPVFV